MKPLASLVKDVKDSIEKLYSLFSIYPRPVNGIKTCLDFGPTDGEKQAFSGPLREIPDRYINRLEFYDTTWSSWGNEAEVKYLLPRIFEAFALDVMQAHKIENMTAFSKLIRFKMLDLDIKKDQGNSKWIVWIKRLYLAFFKYAPFSLESIIDKYIDLDVKKDQAPHIPSKWTQEEIASINRFFLAFFRYLAFSPDSIHAYIDYIGLMSIVSDDMKVFTNLWQEVPNALKSAQIQNWVIAYIDPESLKLKSHYLHFDESVKERVETNLATLKQWVLSEENLLQNIEFFSQDPWHKL